MADNAVRPELDAVLVNGVRVSRGSRVRLRPSRRADAQDLFFADKIARVTSVHEDVDGDQHVGVVLEDDPAADLHDWYGRYLYFAPDEVEPLHRKEFEHGSSGCGSAVAVIAGVVVARCSRWSASARSRMRSGT